MEQIGVVTLLGGRHPPGETLVLVDFRQEAERPFFVGKRRIGHHIIVGAQLAVIREPGVSKRVARSDDGVGNAVQQHVHAGKTDGHHILFLPFKGDVLPGLGRYLEQQGAGAAGRIVGRGRFGHGFGPDADDTGDHAADFGRRVELPLALAAFRSKMPHKVFVGIAQQVVVVRAVLGKVELFVLKDGDERRQAVHHLLARSELGGVVEVREVRTGQRGAVDVDDGLDDLLVDLVADIGPPFEQAHVGKAGACGHVEGGKGPGIGKLVRYVFDEQHEQHIVLVQAGIHAAAKGVAACPEGRVYFRFLDGHDSLSIG